MRKKQARALSVFPFIDRAIGDVQRLAFGEVSFLVRENFNHRSRWIRVRFGTEPVDTVGGGCPELASLVFAQGPNTRAGQTILGAVFQGDWVENGAEDGLASTSVRALC